MPEYTTYYLGRLIKLGALTSDMVINAIHAPVTINWWNNGWSFLNARNYTVDGVSFVCAKLAKFNPDGEVVIADTASNQEVTQAEPNLKVASSFFIYIPELSGIAFEKVYNHIDEIQFPRRFSQVIIETYSGFFVDCHVKMISDLQTFATKLQNLDGIDKIAANIHPPNPIFGPLWEPLKEYLKKRRASTMTVSERSSEEEVLNTDLVKHVKRAAEQTDAIQYLPAEPLPIGDAAILMAADGYGSGTVHGKKDNERIVVRTSETMKNFSLQRDHSPIELFREAYRVLKKIESDRHMEH